MECHKCRESVFDYNNNNLDKMDKIHIENHLKTCDSCRKSYMEAGVAFAKTDDISIFKKISPKGWAIIVVSFCFLLTFAFLSGGLDKFGQSWKDFGKGDKQNIEEIRKYGLNNNVNLSVEDNEIKITITHVLADDIQTYIFYEVEDTVENRLLRLHYDHPPIASGTDTFDHQARINPINRIIDLPNETTDVYRGRIALPPIKEDSTDLEINMSQLVEIAETDTQGFLMQPLDPNTPPVEGDWSFTIPVTKEEIIEKEINIETEIALNHLIKIDKVSIAPTVTLLHYRHESDIQNFGGTYFLFDQLEAEEREYKREDMSYFPFERNYSDRDWVREVAAFDSMYYHTPDYFDLSTALIQENIPLDKVFTIDPDQTEPQVFNFLGSKLSIEDIELGKTTSLTLKQEYTKEREFERIHYQLLTEPEAVSSGYSGDGIIIDKNGEELDQEDINYYDHISGRLRYFSTEEQIEVESAEEITKPIGIHIHSYQRTTFPTKKVRIEMDGEDEFRF